MSLSRSSSRPGRPRARRRCFAAVLAALTMGTMAVLRTHAAEAVPSAAGSAGTIQTMGGVTRDYQQGGYGPEGAPATESQFQNPRGLGFAPNGDLYIGDTLNHRVRRIDANGVVTLVAGNGMIGYGAGDGGPAVEATLYEPHGVAVDSLGNVYIADTLNCTIRRVNTAGFISRFAGTGAKYANGTCATYDGTPDGNASDVPLDRPTSLYMTRVGGTDTLWIADTGHNQIRKIVVVSGGNIVANPQNVRVAGTGPKYYAPGDSRDALDAAFRRPEGLWVADDGSIFVSDTGNNLIRKIAMPAAGSQVRKVSVIAGDVAAAAAQADNPFDVLEGNSDGDGGPAIEGHLDRPVGITGDNRAHLYVAEAHGSRIRRINLANGIVDTVAGDGTILEQRANGGSLAIKGENGPALEAQFAMLHDIQINPADGSLWIADSRHNRIRAIADPADAPGAIVPTGGGSSTPLPTTTTTAPKATTTTTAPTATTTTASTAPPPDTGGTTGDPVVSGSTTGAPAVSRSGYWMVGSDGAVYPFGDAKHHGNAATTSAVDLEPTPSGNGYWVVDDLGRVSRFGDAVFHGNVEPAKLVAGEKVTSLSATTDGGGYWIFTNRGRVLTFGNAAFLGDVSDVKLAGPVLDSIVTPSGRGYYMVASDGGTFSFGDARFYGSMGGQKLNAPVQSLVPDSDGVGYWLVASDGGIFAFEAGFKGSLGSTRLNKPVTGMVRAGTGYLMVGEDGGIFDFSGTPDGFQGSLGARPPAKPITSVAVLEIR